MSNKMVSAHDSCSFRKKKHFEENEYYYYRI